MVKGDLYKEVFKIISKWKPLKRYHGELVTYPDIRNFIDERINAKRRTKISVKAKNNLAKTDISVGNDKVAIEIKYNLNGAGKVRYLVDEIRTQSKSYREGLIILLLGKTNKSDRHDIDDGIRDVRKNLNRNRVYKFPIKIIEKSLTELRKFRATKKKKIMKKNTRKKTVRKKSKSSDLPSLWDWGS